MDQLSEMRVFVRAIERGTFASAAGDLGLTPSAVSKLIARLEARLGVRLVNRTTRKLSLTAEGETYFHSGRRLIDAIDSLEHEVAASARHPRGLLRINTALSFGVQHLAPALIEFHQRYPDARVSVSLTDRPVDLYAQQIEVGGPPFKSANYFRDLADSLVPLDWGCGTIFSSACRSNTSSM
jgi:DNA-binding transcriptional LysR family regulator